MDNEIKDKLRGYIDRYSKYAYALNGWVKLNNKNFTTMQALEAVYNAANGKPMEMNNIITTLTKKKEVYGRRGHVYSDVEHKSIDIVNDNGELSVVGYKGAVKEPETHNISSKNPNIFRKSDGQTKVPYMNADSNIKKIGAFVKSFSPSNNDEEIIAKINAIINFGQKKKISYDKVINGLSNGKFKLTGYGAAYRVVERMGECKKIIVTESALKIFEEIEKEMTYYSFLSNVKSFLKDLLNNPSTAKPSFELVAKGLNRSKLLKYLVNQGIIIRDEKIVDEDEDGNPQTAVMNVKYKVPKNNFDRKMRKLYIKLFERNVPEEMSNDKNLKTEDGGDGATNAMSSGQFSQPMFDVQRRKIYDTKPNEDIEEATTTMNTGDYQYTVPFGGDKSTLKRKNGDGGSISINRIK